MCEGTVELLAALHGIVASLDPATLSGSAAALLVDRFSEMERLVTTARALTAARVLETRAWYASGSSSASAWMASRAGMGLGAAAATLSAAQKLGRLPATRDAAVRGKLSSAQLGEITAAASVDPGSEDLLLDIAKHGSLSVLRERCRDVIAASAGDEDVAERVRRSRFFRYWADREGAVRLEGRLAPDDAAPLIAVVRARADELEKAARRAGHLEHPGAYGADALCSLVDGKGAPKAVVHVIVSKQALERGRTDAGETCRVEGLAPISVDGARRLATSGSIRIVERTATDVRRVTSASRTIPAALRAALEARDEACVVPGCGRRRGLEIDHVMPFSDGGRTELGNLARLCRWHHAQKTHHGWRLEGRPGDWRWTLGRSDEQSRGDPGS